jgi:predicted type IV restriction endonuclease
MVIEVKALGENLKKHENQVVQYMNGGQARWYVLTNGETWELYDRDRPLPLANCLRARIQLADPGALRTLSLLLSKAVAEPLLQEAEEALAEALLAEAAESASIEEQKQAYNLTGHLVKSLQAAVREARERFPLAEPFVERWVQEWKAKLEVNTLAPLPPSPSAHLSFLDRGALCLGCGVL